jgi:hypothetical protein
MCVPARIVGHRRDQQFVPKDFACFPIVFQRDLAVLTSVERLANLPDGGRVGFRPLQQTHTASEQFVPRISYGKEVIVRACADSSLQQPIDMFAAAATLLVWP